MDEPIVHDQPCVKCGGAGPFYVSQPHSWCIECLQRISRQRYARDRLTIMAARQRRALAAAYATPPDARTRRQTMRILQAEAPAGTQVCTWCWRAHPRTRRFWGPGTTADGCDYYCRACRAILDKLRKRPRRRELAPTKAPRRHCAMAPRTPPGAGGAGSGQGAARGGVDTPDHPRRQPRTKGSGVCCHTGGGGAGHVARACGLVGAASARRDGRVAELPGPCSG